MMRIISRPILYGVSLISFGALLLEIILTRIFVVVLWYQFGFLSISLALTGFSVAAICCLLYPDRFGGVNHKDYLAKFAFLFAVFTPISISYLENLNLLNIGKIHFIFTFCSLLFCLFLNFFSAGMCISIVLFNYTKNINKIYCFDLVGAALGSLLVVPLLYHFSPFAITFLISAIASIAGLLFARGIKTAYIRKCLFYFALGCLVMFLANDPLKLHRIISVKNFNSLLTQKKIGKVIFEKWSPISWTTVFPAVEPTRDYPGYMKVGVNGVVLTTLTRFDGDFSKLKRAIRKSRQMVHYLKRNSDTLIIGSAGGRDVLAALKFNQKSITAVEIDPVIVDLVTNVFADYIGRIFDDPRVSIHINEGRHFVAGSPDKYDIIKLDMTDTFSSSIYRCDFIFSENNLYTIEAMDDYWKHLKPDGILSITRFYRWDEALRLTNTIVQHLLRNGIKDIDKRLVVILHKRPNSNFLTTVLLKNGLFSPQEIDTLQKVTAQPDQDLTNARITTPNSIVYAPGIPLTAMEQSDQASLFRAIIRPDLFSKLSREEIIRSHPGNISPTTDDKPFFFYTQSLSDIFLTKKTDHASRGSAILILHATFFFFVIFVTTVIFLPLRLIGRKLSQQHSPYHFRYLFYFAFIGIGYMLMEISFIQRLTVFLGHPTYSFVVVLSTLLCSSGMGALVAGQWDPAGIPKRLTLILKIIVLLGLFFAFIIYNQLPKLMWLGKPWRIFLAVITIIPHGFLAGMCFPMGIRIIRKFPQHLTAWAWGINCAFSVFASIFSLILSLNYGFRATLLTGIICYAVASMIIVDLEKHGMIKKLSKTSPL